MGAREEKIAEIERLRKIEEIERLRAEPEDQPYSRAVLEGMKTVGGGLAKGLNAVSDVVGRPIRAGIEAGTTNRSFSDAYDKPPGWEDLYKRAGLSGENAVTLPLVKNPWGKTKDEKYVGISPAGAAAGATGMVLDPLTYVAPEMIGRGAAKLAGAAAEPIAGVSEKVASYLKNKAADRAVKATTGQNIGALRKIAQSTARNPGDVDRALANIRKTGRDVLDSGAIAPFDRVEDIAPKLTKARQESGARIGQIGDVIDSAVPNAVNSGSGPAKPPDLVPATNGLEIHRGKPSAALDQDHVLVQRNSNNTTYSKSPVSKKETWDIIDKNTDKPVGTIFTETDKETGNTFVRQSNVIDESRGKGLGTKAYDLLSKHYGSLESDHNAMSDAASKLYDRMGAKDIPGSFNAAGGQRKVIQPPEDISGIRKILEDYAASIPNTPKGAPIQDALKERALQYNGPMSFKDAQFEKNQYKYKPGDADALVSNQDVSNKIRGSISKEMENAADRVAGMSPELADTVGKYREEKGRYQSLKGASNAATDRSLKNQSNNFVSPSDYGIGGSILAGGLASGHGALAAVAGAAGAAANKLMRQRGSSTAAVTLNKLSQIAAATPEALSKYAGALGKAAKGGTASLIVTHHLLMNNDPEYAALFQGDSP